MENYISTAPSTPATRTSTAGLRPAPELGFRPRSATRPRGPEWMGRGPAAAGIPEITAPAPMGRVMMEGPFEGRRCGHEFIGAGPAAAGLPVLDPLPEAYTAPAPAAFGEIGRMAYL